MAQSTVTRKREGSKTNMATLAAKKAPAKPLTLPRKSEPIIQMVGRTAPVKDTPELAKKAGQLPTPLASFVF